MNYNIIPNKLILYVSFYSFFILYANVKCFQVSKQWTIIQLLRIMHFYHFTEFLVHFHYIDIIIIWVKILCYLDHVMYCKNSLFNFAWFMWYFVHSIHFQFMNSIKWRGINWNMFPCYIYSIVLSSCSLTFLTKKGIV